MGLARKIYTNLFINCVVTAGILGFIHSNDEWNEYVTDESGRKLLVFALILAMISISSLVCVKYGLYKKFPVNMIMMAIFVLSISYIITFIACAWKDKMQLDLAIYMMLAIVGSCAIISCKMNEFKIK